MASSTSSPLASRPPRNLPRAGASKAQAALARIIAVISAAQTPNTPPLPPPAAERHVIAHEGEATGFRAVDLGLRLGPPPTQRQEIVGACGGLRGDSCCDRGGGSSLSGDAGTADKSSVILPPAAAAEGAGVYVSPAASVAGGEAVAAARSSEGECDPEEEAEGESKADEDVKGVVIVEDEAKGNTARCGGAGARAEASMGDSKRCHGGHLDLLLEAVRQVSGGFFNDEAGEERAVGKADVAELAAMDEPPAAAGRSTKSSGAAKRGKEAAEWSPFDLYEEAAPIVRSKRGRNQALPSRYRDSVIEPWRKPPAVPRHGRSTTKP